MMEIQDRLLILEQMDIGVIVLNEQKQIQYWNKFVAEYSELALEDCCEQSLVVVFPELRDSRLDIAIDNLIAGNIDVDGPNGERSSASFTIKPLLKNNRNMGCIIYFEDFIGLTEEEAPLSMNAAATAPVTGPITAKYNELEKIFEITLIGIVIFDERGNIERANDAALKMFNSQSGDFKKHNIVEYIPFIRDNFLDSKTDKLVIKSPGNTEFEIEIRHDHMRFARVSFGHIVNHHGEYQFFVFMHDITAMKATEQALIRANNELEEFSYRTSHDLRSPLVSSLALMKIARDALLSHDIETSTDCVSLAESSLLKLEKLVVDIVNLTLKESQRERSQSVKVHNIVNLALTNLNSLEGYGTIDIQIDIDKNLGLKTSPGRLTNIIENLLSNAIKYRDPAKLLQKIFVSARIKGRSIIIDIKDNGLGIPMGLEHKLFIMFKRLHTNVSHGSGIGLYLTKKSTQKLGGEVDFIREPDFTHFSLRLPIEPPCIEQPQGAVS